MTPAFYASTLLWNRVEPFVNLAIDFDANDFAQSQARYGAGVDVDIVSRFGVVLAFLGRSQFEDPVNQSHTDFLYLTPQGVQPQPLLGLDLGRKDFFDFSFGFRAVVWRSVMLFANGIYALNEPGSAQRHRHPDGGGRGHLLGDRSRCTGRSSACARRPFASRPIRASCTTTRW